MPLSSPTTPESISTSEAILSPETVPELKPFTEAKPVLEWSILLLVFALLAVSFAAIFIRWCGAELGAGATVFNRLWIATLVLGIWEFFKPTQQQTKTKATAIAKADYGLLILVGAVSSTSVVLWALSLMETSVANSTVLRNLTPLFTSLGAWLFLRQRFDKRFLLGMVVAMAGAIAIGVGDFQLAWHNLSGDVLALLSALCYGINLLLTENLRDRLGATQILLWRCGFGSLLLLPFVLLTEKQLLPHSLPVWGAAIGLAVLCQCFGQGLIVYSLKKFSSGFVAIFLLLEPIITAVFAWFLLGESLTFTNAIAFLGVIMGIYLAKSSRTIQPQSVTQNTVEEDYSSPAT